MEKLQNIKMIALDLDDTLLNSDVQISDKNFQVLHTAAKKGIYIVLCSGRAEHGILPYVRRLNVAGLKTGRFVISTNGCSIFDLHSRTQVYRRDLEPSILLHADEEAKKMGLFTTTYSDDTIYCEVDNKWTRMDSDLCGLKNIKVDNWNEFLWQKKTPKMVIPGEPEKLLVLQEILKKDFGKAATVFTSKPFFLEVIPPSCGKGEAIVWLAASLGIDLSEVAAFGDSYNDESMMYYAGHSVCMINGTDEMKKIAKHITEKDNNNSGVGDFIEKYIL